MASAGPVPDDTPAIYTREDALDDLVEQWSNAPISTKDDEDDSLPFRLSLRKAEKSVKKLEDLVRLLLGWSVRATSLASAPFPSTSSNLQSTLQNAFTTKDAPQSIYISPSELKWEA